MTRSLTVVNTSNWDGEEYLVKTRWKRGNPDAGWEETVLKPGEMKAVFPESMDIEFVEQESKKPEPFYLNGYQVLPSVIATVGRVEQRE